MESCLRWSPCSRASWLREVNSKHAAAVNGAAANRPAAVPRAPAAACNARAAVLRVSAVLRRRAALRPLRRAVLRLPALRLVPLRALRLALLRLVRMPLRLPRLLRRLLRHRPPRPSAFTGFVTGLSDPSANPVFLRAVGQTFLSAGVFIDADEPHRSVDHANTVPASNPACSS